MRRSFRNIIPVLLITTSSTGIAVEPLDDLDALPIVLTPSRIEQAINEAPAAVTIIRRKQIEESGIREIAELFRLVPGMFVVYSNGNKPQVKYHGLDTSGSGNGRHLQVLVDGRSVYQAGFSRVMWNDLPLIIEDIERIEVVRAPSTVSYGANAFMGVINIITRNSADTPSLLSVTTGTGDRRESAFRHVGNLQDLSYRLSMKYYGDDGYDQGTYRDEEALHFLNWRGDYQHSPTDQIHLDLGFKDGDKDVGKISLPTTAHWKNSHQQIRWKRLIDADRSTELTAYHQQINVIHEWSAGNRNWDESRYHLELQYNQNHNDQLRSVSGLALRQDRVKSSTYFGDGQTYKKNSHQLYANLEWRAADHLLLHGGVMWDHEDVGGFSKLSPRVALNYHLTPNHTLRASYSEAIRSPDLLEQYAKWTDPEVNYITAVASSRLSEIGSSSYALRPEQITARELGWHFNLPQHNASGDIRLYQERLSDMTGLTTNSIPTALLTPSFDLYPFTHANLYSAEINGIELETHWTPDAKNRLDLSYGHIFSYHSETEDLSSSSPKKILSAMATHRFGTSLQGSLAFYYMGLLCGELSYTTENSGCSAADFTTPMRRVDLALNQKIELTSAQPATIGLLLRHHLGTVVEYDSSHSNNNKTDFMLTLKSEW